MIIGKANRLFGETIQIRRANHGIAMHAQVAVSLIVSDHHDHVGPSLGTGIVLANRNPRQANKPQVNKGGKTDIHGEPNNYDDR